LQQEAEKQYSEMLESWNKLYECLSQYPDVFMPESISLFRFKWVLILTTNRCFSSNWPGVCQMVPFADQLNHENVDVNYDALDPDTGKSLMTKEEVEARRIKEEEEKQNQTKNFLDDLKNDLQDMTNQLRAE